MDMTGRSDEATAEQRPRASGDGAIAPDMAQALDLSALGMDFFEGLLRPASEREWSQHVGKRRLAIYRADLKRRLLGFAGLGIRRTEDYVRKYYSRWQRHALHATDPFDGHGLRPAVWRGRRVLISPWATNRLTLLRLARLIEALQPRRILEVGTGNGLYPLLLSCAFPDAEFRGIELTPEGVASAHTFQQQDKLPPQWERFMPIPIRDASGFRRAVIEQGTARSLPYSDAQFDLVFTCLALEQMEPIRDSALSEIARVSRGWVSFVEPFRDVNERGLKRAYVRSMNYFQARAADLARYNIVLAHFSDDFPQTFYMSIAHVAGHKKAGQAISQE